jgi:predicted RNA binding protein with dsRBD fold (UPF0201 family)
VSIVEVVVRAIVNPTESIEKVEEAMRRVLGDFELNLVESRSVKFLEGRCEGLECLSLFRSLLKRMRIRDAARFYLIRNSSDGRIEIGLNKQAAYAGKISFCLARESALGPIEIEIMGEVDSIVKYLTE